MRRNVILTIRCRFAMGLFILPKGNINKVLPVLSKYPPEIFSHFKENGHFIRVRGRCRQRMRIELPARNVKCCWTWRYVFLAGLAMVDRQIKSVEPAGGLQIIRFPDFAYFQCRRCAVLFKRGFELLGGNLFFHLRFSVFDGAPKSVPPLRNWGVPEVISGDNVKYPRGGVFRFSN